MPKRSLFLVPLLSALIMILWNLCFDPIFSTIQQRWIWENGGAYFGVPISNFLGWFLTVYLVYQLFALVLYKYSENTPITQGKTYWLIVPIIYLGIALEYMLNPLYQTEHLEIYGSLALMAVFTMGFVSLLGIIHVLRLTDAQLQ
jgi:putative membrane protein